MPPTAGEDSHHLLPVLSGRELTQPLREATVQHSASGCFSIRQGRWKLLLHAARDRKLAEARERRKEQREAARLQTVA